MQLTKHFHLDEFKSPDGYKMSSSVFSNIQELAVNLQVIREALGRPVHINSGFRSPAHNKKVGGVANSQHLLGKAADIRVVGLSPKEVASVIEDLMAQGKIKLGGVGVYQTFVHYDIRGHKAHWKGNATNADEKEPTPTKNNFFTWVAILILASIAWWKFR